jgi:hypothetical protein
MVLKKYKKISSALVYRIVELRFAFSFKNNHGQFVRERLSYLLRIINWVMANDPTSGRCPLTASDR